MIWLRILLISLFLVMLVWPGWVFFQAREGAIMVEGATLGQTGLRLFPLFGLYAFFFVWAQVVIGSNLRWLWKVFPKVELFHRTEGVFALLFALTHPLLLMFGLGLSEYFQYQFVDPTLKIYIWIGYTQLFLICLTAATALLMRVQWMQKIWKYIHFANYAVFALVWIHSWFLGSDVQSSSLKYIWIFFAATWLASLIGRFAHRGAALWQHGMVKTQTVTPSSDKPFVPVLTIDQVQEGKPSCARVGNVFLALFKVGDQVYATANSCSHAGAPLCHGKQEGNVITCPLHGSQYDVTSGKVLRGPSMQDQKTYPVKIEGTQILVQV